MKYLRWVYTRVPVPPKVYGPFGSLLLAYRHQPALRIRVTASQLPKLRLWATAT